jgi:hypothetical protein
MKKRVYLMGLALALSKQFKKLLCEVNEHVSFL